MLARPDFANAGYDRAELRQLRDAMREWAEAFAAVELEFGDDPDELLAKLDELIEAAPEPSDSYDSNDSNSDEDSDEDSD